MRLTGQDTARGTFSQRHLQLHDMGEGETWTPHTGRVYTPMANLLRASASLELHNSPLSEAAAVGFEYGYSTQAPEALVLWEAQYGDFANGAQIMIDQFIVSGRAKWGERSRLTLLLPHGYEGNGPEHSSARIERFLQLAAEDNIRVANCSTAANYFHLLRKQALTDLQRPLIIFTPKSLLRSKAAASRLEDLSRGPLPRGDRRPAHREPARRGHPAASCAPGKIFHEIDARPEREAHPELAIARVEMLFPFPEDRLRVLFEDHPNIERVTWVQEEPRNMGAWEFIRLPARAGARPTGSRSTTAAAHGARAPARATLKHTRPSRSGFSPQPSAARLGRPDERGGGRRGKATRRRAGRRPGRRRGGAARGAAGRARDPDRAGGARRDLPQLGVHPHEGAPGDGRPAAAGAARVASSGSWCPRCRSTSRA